MSACPTLVSPSAFGIAPFPDSLSGDMGGFQRFLIERSYARTTIRHYVAAVSRAERWLDAKGQPPLRRCSPQIVASYVSTTPYTNATRSLIRNALVAYWLYLGRREFPAWVVKVPRKPPMICRALEESELEALFCAAQSLGTYEYAAIACMYFAALRREETCSLRWEDFLEGGWLRVVGKYATEHRLPVHEKLVDILGKLPRTFEWVFPGRLPGTHVSPNTINVWVNLAAARAGLEGISPHRLRHSSLAFANDRTGDLRAVQSFARHRDPAVTAGYTRATEAKLRQVVGVL